MTAIKHFLNNNLPLPANEEELASYIITCIGKKHNHAPATLAARMAAVRKWHISKGYDDPTTLKSIKSLLHAHRVSFYAIRSNHSNPRLGPAQPFDHDNLPDVLNIIRQQSEVKAARDCALLLVGFFGGFGATSLLSLKYGSIKFFDSHISIRTLANTRKRIKTSNTLIPNNSDNSSMCPSVAIRSLAAVGDIKQDDYMFKRISSSGEFIDGPPLATQTLSLFIRSWLTATDRETGESVKRYSSQSLRNGFLRSKSMADSDLPISSEENISKDAKRLSQVLQIYKMLEPEL